MTSLKKISALLLSVALTASTVACSSTSSTSSKNNGEVKFQTGRTPIPGGAAINENDITMYNDKIAVSFAVDTANPWGNPKGSIIDATTITDGKFDKDRVYDVEFLADEWSSWVSDKPEKVYVDTENSTETKGIVIAERTFVRDNKSPVTVITTYTLEAGSNEVEMVTKFENTDKKESYTDLLSGYTMTNLGGYMFGPFGYSTTDKKTKKITVNEPLGQYITTYNKDYTIALHVPDTNRYTGTSGYKDLYQLTTLQPGESKTFNAILQIEKGGSNSPVTDKALALKNEKTGTLKGKIDSDGKTVANPILVVEKEGQFEDTTGYTLEAGTVVKEFQPFTWTVGDENGNYELNLPSGEYKVYAIAENYAPTQKMDININAGDVTTQDFNGLAQGGTVNLSAFDKSTNEPLDARIEVKGATLPVVRYLGSSTYFTDLDKTGNASFVLDPNVDYQLNISSGKDFVSKGEDISLNLKPGETKEINVGIDMIIDPNSNGWYGADLHHHSNLGDGITPPKDLVISELSSQLDLLFISDHDEVENHDKMKELAKTQKKPFIPSLEVSPSWAHFNILNMPSDKSIDPKGTAAEIMKAGHDLGCLVISNHPYTSYGYFTADESNTIPGGYVPDFDLVELQPTMNLYDNDNYEKKTLDRVYKLWNEQIGQADKKYYLTGGTDTHDVWSTLYSGIIRSFVKVDGELTEAKFLDELMKGHAYVSMGPIVDTDKMFAETYNVKSGEAFNINIKAQSVNGIKKVYVMSEGNKVAEKEFDGTNIEELFQFDLVPTKNTWYNFIIEDTTGKTAVTNPVWVNVTE